MIESLETLFGSSDENLRRDALLAVKEPPQGADRERCANLLVRGLKDASWRVRKTAVEALLGSYPIASYVHGVLELLYIEDNAGARNSAIEVLTRLGPQATSFLIDAFDTNNKDVRKFIVDIIGIVLDRESIPILLKALKDPDENVKASAVEHLGAMKEPTVVDVLLEILKDADLWTAYPAIEALGKIGDPRVIPALLEKISEKTLREPVVRALGRLGDHTMLEHMVPHLEDKSRIVRQETLRAIERLYHRGVSEEHIAGALFGHFGPKITEMLVEFANSPRQETKGAAILMLGLLRDCNALLPLMEIAEDAAFTADAFKALVYIGRKSPEAIFPLFRGQNSIRQRFISSVMAEIAHVSYKDIFIDMLGHDDGHVRANAARGLANIGDASCAPEVLKLISDPYEDVREVAVEAASALRAGLDEDVLIAMLKNPSAIVRQNITLVLGSLESERAIAAVGFSVKDESPIVRRAAVDAIGCQKSASAHDYLLRALTDEDPDIRIAATLALGNTRNPKYFKSLLLMLSDPEDMVRVGAAKALGTFGSIEALPQLSGLRHDPNGFVVATCLESIGMLGGNEAKNILVDMLGSSDSEIRRTSLHALKGFSGVEDMLLPFVRHNDWATRVAAIEGLESMMNDAVAADIKAAYDREDDPIVRECMERVLGARKK